MTGFYLKLVYDAEAPSTQTSNSDFPVTASYFTFFRRVKGIYLKN
jgi:hypothetical protein